MHRALVGWLSSAVLVTALAGCGGGGSSTPPEVATVHPDQDGVVFSNGIVNDDGTEFSAGDNASDVTLQTLMSFPLSLPAEAAIERAVLRLHGAPTFGATTNPHLPELLVEHVLTDFGAIDATDFAADPGSLTSCGGFPSPAEDWNELDVTASVQDDLAASRGKSLFRLYRATLTDGDAAWDYDGFYASESPTDPPELVITYRP